MRVCLVCPYSWSAPGGVQGHVAGLAAALRRRGHDVEVAAPVDGAARDAVRAVARRTVPVPDNGSVQRVALDPFAWPRTARAVRGFDVVHVHEPMLPWVGMAATLAAEAPLVGTFHMYAERSGWYRIFRPVARPTLARLDVRIAVSDAARDHVARSVPGDYRVIPNGVDAARLARLGGAREEPRVLFVGRPEPRKGLPVLLDALRQLPPETTLDLVGPGPADVPPDLAPRVRAHGRVDDRERDRLLSEAAVLCAPSTRGESFGIVLVEGMGAGLPVVATRIRGYADVLPARCGRLVEPGDPGALATELRELLADPELRRRLGEAGREEARRYDWGAVAERVLEAYADAGAR